MRSQRQIMAEISRRIRVVFFDLDETLLDDDRCMHEAVARTCATLARRYPHIESTQLETTYVRVAAEWWASSGSVPRASSNGGSGGRDIRLEVWSKALMIYGLPIQHLAIEATDLYSQERKADYCLFPDAKEVIHALHQRFILGVISNGPRDTQRQKLDATGLVAYLNVVVISGELGIGKRQTLESSLRRWNLHRSHLGRHSMLVTLLSRMSLERRAPECTPLG